LPTVPQREMSLFLLARMFVGLSGMGWRLNALAGHEVPVAPATDGVSRELTRLDPFSFFVIQGEDWGADYVVVGATGTFAVRIGETSVDGRVGRDLRRTNRAVQRVKEGAGVARVHTSTHGVLCLPGRQFRPRN